MLDDRALKSSLETGVTLPVYIIAGEDVYLKKQALDRIIAATVEPGDDMNLIRFAHNVELQQVYDELNGFPIMADKKCVVLVDYDINDADKSDFENLLELAGDPVDTSVFVIYFGNTEIDFKKSDRFKKLLAAAEKAGGALVRTDHKTSGELARWLVASAKKRGCNMSPNAATYMVEVCSADVSTLSGEIEKLCFFVDGGDITRETVDRVCVKSIEASVNDLSAKIMAGDSAAALKFLDELFFANVEPYLIFYNIASSVIDMFRVLAAKAVGKRPEDIAGPFKYGKREFLLRRAQANLKKFDAKKLDLAFDALIKAEGELKSFGGGERLILEKLIVRIIYIMKTGEALD